ncbi:MAG TPA: tripartite tricarboxylate transporter TctB family protein [Pseudonocardiaceae bacterium]|jgi:putative tricarboxylic transport membrane protein|nr:tripartite tricarboxylate transporter TctB family protein [Pseudonocardiaceae bacterium]
MQRADVVAGTVVAALGAFALVTALNLAFLSDSGVPGPGFFPTLLSGLLLLLGVLLAATSLRRRSSVVAEERPERQVPGDIAVETSQRARVLRAGTVWICFLVAVPILAVLGFVPAMAILIAALLFGVERRLNWKSLVVAIVVPVAVYELFVHLLTIPLPTGVISIGPLSS